MNHSLDLIVRRNSRRFPRKVALSMAGRSLDWRTLDERVEQAIAVGISQLSRHIAALVIADPHIA